MSLPELERDILFDMLEPHLKPFELDDILQDDGTNLSTREEVIKYLIKNVFSKYKKS